MRRPSLFFAYSTYSKQIKKTKFTKSHLEFPESCLDLLRIYLNYLSSRFKQNKYGDVLLMYSVQLHAQVLTRGRNSYYITSIIYYSLSLATSPPQIGRAHV